MRRVAYLGAGLVLVAMACGAGKLDAGFAGLTGDGGVVRPDGGPGSTFDAGPGQPLACARIMPLGDSITEGPEGGYRNHVYTALKSASCNPDMVGSMTDQWTQVEDKNHEGHPGFTIDNLAENIDGWLSTYQPSHVLLMAGTNDLAWWSADTGAQVADEQAALVDRILTRRPTAWVLVASIAPITSQSVGPNNWDRAQLVRDFNAALETRINQRAAAGKRVRFVNVNAVLTLADLYDGVHPNAEAHVRIGAAWMQVLRPLVTCPNTPGQCG